MEEAKGRPEMNHLQVIGLTVDTIHRDVYKRSQHECLNVQLGEGGEWETDVDIHDQDASERMKDMEEAVPCFTLTVVGQDDTASQIEALAVLPGHEQAIAALMASSRYVAHEMPVNTLALTPPVSSILENEFGG